MITVLDHPVNQSRNDTGGSDLSKIFEQFKMLHQRLKLSRVICDCIIVRLPRRCMRRKHRRIRSSAPDSLYLFTAPVKNGKQTLCADNVVAYHIGNHQVRAIIDVREPKPIHSVILSWDLE